MIEFQFEILQNGLSWLFGLQRIQNQRILATRNCFFCGRKFSIPKKFYKLSIFKNPGSEISPHPIELFGARVEEGGTAQGYTLEYPFGYRRLTQHLEKPRLTQHLCEHVVIKPALR